MEVAALCGVGRPKTGIKVIALSVCDEKTKNPYPARWNTVKPYLRVVPTLQG